jgi:pyruvate dehydrogenase E2 component (dihydrolipoamide acetyltransferase)
VRIFRLPDLGEGLREAEIVEWHVAAGDRVVAGQRLLTVETDKALVEVAAPWAGRIGRPLAVPGTRGEVGMPLVEFAELAAGADAGALVGELPETLAGAPGGPPLAAAAARAVPRVRALAARLGVDLARVGPSGPQGTVTEADVERAAAAAADFEPVRGVRLAMARNMARADAVTATVADEVDVERWAPAADVTVRLIRAVAAGCAASPSLNAWFDGRRLARRLHAHVDCGVAMQTPDGLFVPVLRDVARRDPDALRRDLDALAAAVRARTVTHAELRGATITLSNFGPLGGRFGALVVVPPQVAILGAGRVAPRVVAIDGRAAVRRLLPLSLTFDHRAVTGEEAARFLSAVTADLIREA